MKLYMHIILKKTILASALAVLSLYALPQSSPALYFDDRESIPFVILETGTLIVHGNIELKNEIKNAGTITSTGSLYNNSSSGNGFVKNRGTVILDGNNHQEISGTTPWNFTHLHLKNSTGHVHLKTNSTIDSSLVFYNAHLHIYNNRITIERTGSLIGEKEDTHVFADSMGKISYRAFLQLLKDSLNIAGLGLHIHAPQHIFGESQIHRSHHPTDSAGKGSIARSYEFKPSVPQGQEHSPTERVTITYFEDELNQKDENKLAIYARRHNSNLWRIEGGNTNISANTITTHTYNTLGHHHITIAEIPKNATCHPTYTNYTEAIYIVASEFYRGDTVYFINLSLPHPDSVANYWNFGDRTESPVVHPVKIYDTIGILLSYLSTTRAECMAYQEKQLIVRADNKRFVPDSDSISQPFTPSLLYYPNPAKDHVRLQMEIEEALPISFSLFDMYGKIRYRKEYHTKLINDDIPLHRLPQGVYIANIEAMGKKFTHKIIKQ